MQRREFTRVLLLIASISLVISTTKARADVELPHVISSHMVLQRDMAVPIWGTAAPGEKVTVGFRGQEKSAVADGEGKWQVKLDALKAGGPDAMKIAGSNTITLEDVLVGEVWVGSGQSNMDLPVNEAKGGDPVLAAAATNSYPKIRMIVTAAKGWKLGKTGWQEASPENNAEFAALLFAFGVSLQKDLDVPVGLIEAAVGCSVAGHWVSEELVASDPVVQDLVKRAYAGYDDKTKTALAEWQKAVEAAKKEGKEPPFKPWEVRQPGDWVATNKHTKRLGPYGCFYDSRLKPVIPYGIRGVVWDQGERGTGIKGEKSWEMDMTTFMGVLIRLWRQEWGQPPPQRAGAPGGNFPFIYVQKPSGPGCAWNYEDPVTKRASQFATLPDAIPETGNGGAKSCLDFINVMKHPNTAMAISSDLGTGLHPPNKWGYGSRCARVALGMVYGRDIEIYGPVYETHTIEGDKVRVRFTHRGRGLAWKHGEKLQGFTMAGEDKMFHWADAVIDGDTVVVSSDKVKAPVAVRYGWGQDYPWANLFNKDGLPAIPFRTDDWE